MKKASAKEAKRITSEKISPFSNEYKERYLFLLEFFVQSVGGSRLAMLNRMFFVPTSISFQFLDFRKSEGIEVTPVDPIFEPQAAIADDLVEYFYAGRSVMFALDEHLVSNKIMDFVVTMFVRKKLPREIKPDILVGVGRIDLSKHFAALKKELLQDLQGKVPPPKVFEGKVPLMHENKSVGFVDVYVRISAFGETITTEFEVPIGDKMSPSYVFKGNEWDDKPLAYKCRIVGSDTGDIPVDAENRIADMFPCVPCGHPSGATYRTDYGNPADDIPETQRLSMRETEKQDCGKAVVLKVSGFLNSGGGLDSKKSSSRKPLVTVTSESEAIRPGDPALSHPDYDVFILRIGKKGLVGPTEKSDIQLEMKTPRGAERGPPIRWETREMQTEEEAKVAKKKSKKK